MSFLCSKSVGFHLIFRQCRKNPSMAKMGLLQHYSNRGCDSERNDLASAACTRSQLIEHGDQAVNNDQYPADLHDGSSR